MANTLVWGMRCLQQGLCEERHLPEPSQAVHREGEFCRQHVLLLTLTKGVCMKDMGLPLAQEPADLWLFREMVVTDGFFM